MLGKRQTKYLIATVLYLALIYVSAVTYDGILDFVGVHFPCLRGNEYERRN